MKKIMVIALILIASFAFADSWLSVEYGFQFGWVPNGNIEFYQPASFTVDQPFNITFDINFILFSNILFGGDAVSNFSFTTYGLSPVNFAPSGIVYTAYLGFKVIDGISVFYQHSCIHPILNYSGSAILQGGYDRIYVEIKGKINY